MHIKFGTSGWRAIISDEFTFDNVFLVTQAIADYIKKLKVSATNRGGFAKKFGERSKKFPAKAGSRQEREKVIVGYDTRFLSREFAQASAEVLAKNNIKVFLTDRDTPTPVIAFHILKKKAAGAINITASHNPPEYNGIKFSGPDAGPALPAVTSQIEKNIKKFPAVAGSRLWREKVKSKKLKVNQMPIVQFNPRPEYLSHIRKLIDLSAIKRAKLSVIADCLYGTARGYLDKLLKEAGCKLTVLNNYPDPLFGGKSSDVSKENLKNTIKLVKKTKADLGLATDGDADRFGIIDKGGIYISPNEVISVLFWYLINTRKKLNKVARTTATTHFIDRIADYYGIKVVQTPVGFKYIGQLISGGDCIIGGEESGGLSVAGHLPEKDGILASLLICEMVSVTRKSIKENLQFLYKKFGRVFSERIDFKLDDKLKKYFLKNLNIKSFKKIIKDDIIRLNKKDGYKFYLKENNWILFRFSGTEPVARCYIETDTQHKIDELTKAIKNFLK